MISASYPGCTLCVSERTSSAQRQRSSSPGLAAARTQRRFRLFHVARAEASAQAVRDVAPMRSGGCG
ncbi:unnamed protein product [Lampetra planeri]